MSQTPISDRESVVAAGLTAAAMIAHQVAGKAARDALFLDAFPVTSLPVMLAASAIVSILVSVAASGALGRVGPRRVTQRLFVASAALQLVEFTMATAYPGPTAVLVFLHMGVLGPVVASSFWSAAAEQFDPRSARRLFARFAAAGTLGGLLGGLAGERIATAFGVPVALLLLAALHVVCAASMGRMGSAPAAAAAETAGGWRELPALIRVSYLRRLLVIVVVLTVSAALLDYVFKVNATQDAAGPDLMRVFSFYYIAVALLTFVVQAFVAPRMLEKAGLGMTIGTLPAAVSLGSMTALLAPGLVTAGLARGVEAMLRNSLFRSAYEILFASVPRDYRRATKMLADVGGERVGDVLGSAVVGLTILLLPGSTNPALLVFAAVLGVVGLWLTPRLQRGYVASLEDNLVRGNLDLARMPFDERATRMTLLHTALSASASRELRELIAQSPEPAGPPPPSAESEETDPEVSALASREPQRVMEVLRQRPFPEHLVERAAPLLAWDLVAVDAAQALRHAPGTTAGVIAGFLRDPGQAFAIRRRIPAVLEAFPTTETIAALIEGLSDTRFEVRYRCGRMLRRMVESNPSLTPDRNAVLSAVVREASVGRRVWQSQRLLDRDEAVKDDPVDEVLRERASLSLLHVFNLLALCYRTDALRVAFRGLHTDDRMLRGTALEYLESMLPAVVWSAIRPYLDDDRTGLAPARTTDTVLDELLKSHASIELRLDELRRGDDR